jgi:hypothetical protein
LGEADRGFDDSINDADALVGTRSHAHRGSGSAGRVRCTAADDSCPPARPASAVWNASVEVLRRTRQNADRIRAAAPDLTQRTSCRGARGSASLPAA